MLISQFISAIIQVLLFTAIPWLFWKVTKPAQPFLSYLGLKKVTPITLKLLLTSLAALLGFLAIGSLTLNALTKVELANSHFQTLNLSTVLAICIYAFIQTALAEEILFRGFLAKRLINHLGLVSGNLVQAGIFGLLHGSLLLLQQPPIWITILITLFTGTIGFVLGWINEKLAKGSIMPSWLIHGLTNLISSLLVIL